MRPTGIPKKVQSDEAGDVIATGWIRAGWHYYLSSSFKAAGRLIAEQAERAADELAQHDVGARNRNDS